MKRWLPILAVAAMMMTAFVVGTLTAAPGDLTRTNNSGGNATRVPAITGTPCWRLGSQTFRPEGTPFSACTATTTTTTTTTTRPPTTTGAPSTTTLAPTTTSTTTPTTPTTTTLPSTTTSTTSTVPPTTTQPPSGVQFSETFDNNGGLNRFRYGVYHRAVGYREAGQTEPFLGADNNSVANATWTADHDLACGGPETQRTLRTEGTQDTTGANGWRPLVNFHTSELVYICKDHLMSSMGDVSGFDVLWFSPNQVFTSPVNSVSFEVNLTNLGDRKWWKVGVVSDSLFNTTYPTGWNGAVRVPSFVVSDVGSSDLDPNLQGSDRLIATWGGGASAGYPGCLKIGNQGLTGVCTGQNNDKMTRFPVALVDNHNGTVTFTVNGVSLTRSGSFPACPCRVVFYDQNYTPDKDGPIQGHTWHWDAIVVR